MIPSSVSACYMLYAPLSSSHLYNLSLISSLFLVYICYHPGTGRGTCIKISLQSAFIFLPILVVAVIAFYLIHGTSST